MGAKTRSSTDALITQAKLVQRLQTERRKLRRKLAAVEKELKTERKALKALQADYDSRRRPDIAPSRLHSGTTGYALHDDLGSAILAGLESGETQIVKRKH